MGLHNYGQKSGFTLAETLITLAIIGVVAAVVLPSFISDIQDRHLTAMWKKKYSEISNIYNIVKQDIGGDFCIDSKSENYTNLMKCKKINQWVPPYTYTTLSPEFVNKFVSHLKVVESCGRSQYGDSRECGNYEFKWVGYHRGGACGYYGSLAENKGQPGSSKGSACGTKGGLYSAGEMSHKAVLLADGSVIYFGGSATGMIFVDVNGFVKGPNVVGRDLFAVMINEDWAKPIGATGTFNPSANGQICECSKDYGSVTAQSFLGSGNHIDGQMISGACCSATKLGL